MPTGPHLQPWYLLFNFQMHCTNPPCLQPSLLHMAALVSNRDPYVVCVSLTLKSTLAALNKHLAQSCEWSLTKRALHALPCSCHVCPGEHVSLLTHTACLCVLRNHRRMPHVCSSPQRCCCVSDSSPLTRPSPPLRCVRDTSTSTNAHAPCTANSRKGVPSVPAPP